MTTVVGWNLEAGQVLLRSEAEELSINLEIRDLKSGKKRKTYRILDSDDPGAQREDLRAKRWKAAEADLKQRHFTITPEAPTLGRLPWHIDTRVIDTSARRLGRDPDEHIVQDLEVRQAGHTRTLARGVVDNSALLNSVESTSVKDGVLSPDQRYVVVLAGNECFTEVVTILDLGPPARAP